MLCVVSGLGGEQARWKETAEGYEQDRINLVGNMALSAGYAPPLHTAGVKARSVVLRWGAVWV